MQGDRDVTTSCWDAGIRRDLTSMAAYLARRDLDAVTSTVVQRTDAVVLCGSAVLQALDTAVAALITQSVPRLLITGGVGHSTELLRDAVRRHRAKALAA